MNEIERKQKQIDYIKQHYGFDFPMVARYKRFDNRVYFATDFKDGELIEFFYMVDVPSAMALGNAFYQSIDRFTGSKLINIKELEPYEQDGGAE